ncbi:hypothetical protein PQX77_007743 [Marasmius sp. AFHP31]|nr:hypothetical protein PQX77_007743 [Marasmius sp. AFHP31]
MSNKKQAQSFPLKDVLRDLAVLRVSDIELATLLPSPAIQTDPEPSQSSAELQRSYEYVQNARAVIRIKDRGTLDSEVSNPLEKSRNTLEETLKGLGESQQQSMKDILPQVLFLLSTFQNTKYVCGEWFTPFLAVYKVCHTSVLVYPTGSDSGNLVVGGDEAGFECASGRA